MQRRVFPFPIPKLRNKYFYLVVETKFKQSVYKFKNLKPRSFWISDWKEFSLKSSLGLYLQKRYTSSLLVFKSLKTVTVFPRNSWDSSSWFWGLDSKLMSSLDLPLRQSYIKSGRLETPLSIYMYAMSYASMIISLSFPTHIRFRLLRSSESDWMKKEKSC